MPRKNIKLNKPPVLIRQTQKSVQKIEKMLDGTFLSYWNSPGGSVCHNDVMAFYEIMKYMKTGKKLYLFLKSNGGDGEASLRIVNLLRKHFSKIIAILPLECASAATMIALGADEIHMGPLAYLTAIDTSLCHSLSPVDKNNQTVSVSQDELTRVIRLWHEYKQGAGENPYKSLYTHIHPLVFGAIDRASSLSIKLCKEILSYHIKDAKVSEKISQHLNSNYPSHEYPITLREAERIGLKVKPIDAELNDLLLELNSCYSEMGQRALTDYDEENYHNNEILNILEGDRIQIYYQNDKDWHYRKEERRWVPLNDLSSWYRQIVSGKKITSSKFHIR